MRALLLYPDLEKYRPTGYDDAWRRALQRAGCTLDVLHGPPAAWALHGPPRWDLVIPHVLIEDAVRFGPGLRAAAALEASGATLLNPVAAILASTDKLVTHAVWAAHGLAQPATWPLEELRAWPAGHERLVLKPAWGDGARHLALVDTLAEARAAVEAWRRDEDAGGELRGPALLQEWVAEPRCLRVFATPGATSLAYEKDRRPGALITHGTVYPRVAPPSAEVAALAQDAVAALGGGLMGLDVLLAADGRALALEANAPFGFDVTDPAQGDWVARAALARAAAGAVAA